MPKRLESAYSAWVDDPAHPDGPYAGEARQVYEGHMRIVRNARRAKLLKRRGVEVDCYTNPMGIGGVAKRFWVWFETQASYNARMRQRKLVRSLRAKTRDAQRLHGQKWVHHLLLDVLRPYQRAVLLAPENPGGLTYDMTKAKVLYVPDVDVDLE